ncbi:hypothetical protein [Roseicyclus persicicus]|uniref:Secreted protein n=1 Tax=Roseicyclus persicicus TaxID=2650661 RepID=A0A7X6H0I5_9RHOB|nr:hypothetical protein [Roseibacterium persicicum]NKX44557.1 hypothetical protein [Roseibacterium persicicum]
MLRALALSLILACPAAAQSPTWPGAEDPGFAAARDAWLSGADDMAALGQLSALAQAGNPAAQALLGAVVADGLVPAAVEALPRADRIALTRAPGGLSGTSWLRVAGADGPVAAALATVASGLSQATPAEMAAALQTLLDAGETGAAYRALVTLYNIGGLGPEGAWTQVAAAGAHPALQGHGLPLLEGLRDLLSDPATGVSDPVLLAVVTATLAAVPDRKDLDAPLAALCTAGCPSAPEGCTAALAQATGGLVGFVTLSPVEGLVDSATYQASPRFALDLRTRMAPAADRVGAADACAASLLR